MPFRPDRPVQQDLSESLRFRARNCKRLCDVEIDNLHYRQLTTAVRPSEYFEGSLDKRFEGVQRLHAEIWLNFFQINGKPPLHYKTINRLSTLSLRELKMKRTTAFRLVLQRMLHALGSAELSASRSAQGTPVFERWRKRQGWHRLRRR
jgi:hypothetical protein